MKRAIRYHRFSSDGQSHHSIDRQDAITAQWCGFNNVAVSDTYTDEGYTAKNFDRPDIKALFAFVAKNHQGIDYLVVSELTRFSREAGDAINMVKKIQSLYDIRIVSASRGSIYDCLDHNSFFMMGLEFLLGNSENIKRTNDINGGIYAAKIKGKWIQGGAAPYGYVKEGAGADRRLVVHPDQAEVVRYIFESYLCNTPEYVIKERARQRGFSRTSSSAIREVLLNPIYAGYQVVKSYKELPGGLFPGNWEAIIDMNDWQRVQDGLKGVPKQRTEINDDLPLRGVLACHCGRKLTGAPSTGRHGKKVFYYKCQTSAHNSINAGKAHEQLHEALGYLSLPERLAAAIKRRSESLLEERMKSSRKTLESKKREMEGIEKQISSVEEKWINNQMSHDTYHRWHGELSHKGIDVKAEITRLGRDQDGIYFLPVVHINNRFPVSWKEPTW